MDTYFYPDPVTGPPCLPGRALNDGCPVSALADSGRGREADGRAGRRRDGEGDRTAAGRRGVRGASAWRYTVWPRTATHHRVGCLTSLVPDTLPSTNAY